MLPALTIFLGAFLVFFIQPLIGNTLLPVFGGTASVWSVCLAAFQILLVGGYFYAGVACVGKRRAYFHIAITAMCVPWLWFVSVNYSRIAGWTVTFPIPAIGALLAVLALVAVPYVLLSANSSLVQVLAGGKYRLYAVSNLGSMCGLVAYPFGMEPYFDLSNQWKMFAALTGVYSILLLALAIRSLEARFAKDSDEPASFCATRSDLLRWFGLSFISCFMLNAVSTHLCVDITPLPMLWVVLLAAYLLSYVLSFTDRGASWARWATIALVPLAGFAAWHFGEVGYAAFLPELWIGTSFILLGGWIVHSRLYRSRPVAAGLTRFYLMIALGGAVGGAICSFLMPLVSTTVMEYPIALALVLGVVVADWLDVIRHFGADILKDRRVGYGILAALIVFAGYGFLRGLNAEGVVIARYRNFYGLGYVAHRQMTLDDGSSYSANEFLSNGTVHGFQLANGDWKGCRPTAYFVENAGGMAIQKHPKYVRREPLRVAVCGMGMGTLGTYVREGDYYRFYEINPAVADLAKDTRFFSFIDKPAGTIDIVLDDARRALEHERDSGAEKYDVIIVDVFNGDSIPPHMATREAFALYLDRLAEGGILSFHLSNWHLDLLPMVKSAAKEFGLNLDAFTCRPTKYSYESVWSFMAPGRLPDYYDKTQHDRVDFSKVKDLPIMTDDFHTLLPYIRFNVSMKD